MRSSLNGLLFLIIGICTALCHGVWYTVFSSDGTFDDDLSRNKTATCVNKESQLFYISDNRPNIDQASLVLSSAVSKKLMICIQSDICEKCSALKLTELQSGENKSALINTAHPVVLYVSHVSYKEELLVCRKHVKFGEHGHYALIISNHIDNSTDCLLHNTTSPINNNIALYITLAICLGSALLWIFIKFIYRKGWLYRISLCMPVESLVSHDLGTPNMAADVRSEEVAIQTKPRLRSLDTFRGISLLMMIFVNYGGGSYWFFHHAAWDGLTVADLVFPWFVFIMGTSITISFKSQLCRHVPRRNLFGKVIRRSLILFALGLVISNRAKKGREVSLTTLRIPGVLQRLAVSYLIVGVLEVFFAQAADIHQHKWWSSVRDIIPFWQEWLVSGILLLVHVCITFLLPVPNCPSGYLGPGGLHHNSSFVNCTGGAAGYIDRWFFGASHIYQHPTCKVPYLTVMPHDPEGILGCLTSAFLCLLGLQAGKILIYHQDWVARVKRWLLWCLLTGITAGILCKFSQYDGWIPVNKNLWSISYILAAASMAFFLLMVCYLLVDVFNYWSGAPFFFTGMNSIVVYLCSEVFSTYFPVQFSVRKTHGAQLAMALWGTFIWCFVAAILYYKKIFIAI